MVDIKKLEPVGGTISVVKVPVSMLTASNMPMRDYFAAKAMAAILTDGSWHGHTCSTTAETAYEMADAMLIAREQK